MKKISNAPKTTTISGTVGLRHKEMLTELVEDGIYQSISEALRAAIKEIYKQEKPPYIHNRSAADLMKRKQLEKEREFEETSDHDYALSLNALILTDTKGQEHACFHVRGNMVHPIPVEGIKALRDDENFKYMVGYHAEKLEERTIEDALRGKYIHGIFKADYDIIIPEEISGIKDLQKGPVERTDKQGEDSRDDTPRSEVFVPAENIGVASERDGDSDPEGRDDSGLQGVGEGGSAGYHGDNAPERPAPADRGEDREGSAAPGAGGVLGAIEKIRSHGPNN